KHRAMWALGDYPTLARAAIPDLGATLVDACGVAPGQHVLDVACGSGNATIPAACCGADVIGADLTPALVDAGRRAAQDAGIGVEWREADAESMPFDDGSFDVVMSCVGVMFAPHHQLAADELVRVCRPGGTIGLISWTADGFIGEMLGTLRPFAPTPAPGAEPPTRWGDETYVRTLFGDHVTDLHARRQTVTVEFPDPTSFRESFATMYGPTVAVYASITEPERVAALDAALEDLARRHDRGSDRTLMEWEYLLVTATSRQ
ncbi:MAG: class I SAM-dependent methyltransferase, partial [Actinobacteria bacterium]|nr:class I SAM-dependent methyltransferase [Actinomycetota bacterium]